MSNQQPRPISMAEWRKQARRRERFNMAIVILFACGLVLTLVAVSAARMAA